MNVEDCVDCKTHYDELSVANPIESSIKILWYAGLVFALPCPFWDYFLSTGSNMVAVIT